MSRFIIKNLKIISLIFIFTSLMVVSLLPQITSFPFEEGFESETFPPAGWTLLDADGDGHNWHRITSSAYPTNSGIGAIMGETYVPGVPPLELTPDNYLITPAISLPESQGYLRWYVRTLVNWAAAESYSILISTTTPTIDAFVSVFSEVLAPVNTSWTERTLSLEDYANQTIYIAIRHHTPTAQYSMFIDDFSVFIPLSYDLKALALIGQHNPTTAVETTYTISVQNVGSQIAEGYTVRLMSGSNILSTASGIAVEPNEITNIPISWTPTQPGVMTIYGEIVWEQDSDLTNNQTETMNIEVMPAGFINVYIGNQNSSIYDSLYPFAFGLENGVSQIIYLESEINATGLITHLTYTFNGYGNITQPMPVKIYLGTTSLSVFPNNDSWLPYNDFTLVFDGFLPVDTSGIVDMLIPLDEPYQYDGGNLVIMNHNIYTTYWKSGNRWLLSETSGQNRTLYYNSTSYVVNPSQGLPAGTRHTRIANLALLLSTGSIGSLSGIVTHSMTGQPLDNVVVSIDGTVFNATTNSFGEYSISYIPGGSYTLNATKQGFIDAIVPDFMIYGNDDNVLDFIMSPTPLINISGIVKGSDTMAGLEGALVLLSGIDENKTVTTNAAGEFLISDVLIDQSYTLIVSKSGYNRFIEELVVSGGEDIILDTILLAERANPPSNLIASDFTSYMHLSFREPMIGNDWFSHASLDINTGVGTNSPATFTMVQRFDQEQLQSFGVSGAKLTKVAFVPMREATYSIRIFSGGSDNPLNSGNMIHEQPILSSSLIWAEWNEILLSSEIDIPDTGELWIGVHIITPTGHPAGVDFGPQVHGYGDVLFYQGNWYYMQALNTIAPLPYNWLIRGYAEGVTSITMNANNKPYFRNSDTDYGLVELGEKSLSIIYYPFSINKRILTGYNIYRANINDISNEAAWTLLTQNHATTTYEDYTWSSLSTGDYRYIIKAVYSDSQQSSPIFSNVVAPFMTSRVSIVISTDNQALIDDDAVVRLVNNNGNPDYEYKAYPKDNMAYFPSVWQGNYTLTVDHPAFLQYTNPNININTNPFEYEVIYLVLNVVLSESFESPVFPPDGWKMIDADGDDWNWSRQDFAPAFGQYHAISQSAYTVGGGIWIPLEPDNYLITPRLTLNHEAIINLRFFVRCDPGVPFETFSVSISEQDATIEKFVPIYTETLSNATSQWSARNIDLSDYAGKSIYLAWRHFDSYDMNLMSIDGIVIHSSGGYEPEENYPPPTDLIYSLKNNNDVVLNWHPPILGVRGQRCELDEKSLYLLSPPHKGRQNEALMTHEPLFSTPYPRESPLLSTHPHQGGGISFCSNLQGYRVYRDDNPITDVITENIYVDNNVPCGKYVYAVVAVYYGGVSEPVSVEVDIPSTESEEPISPLQTSLIGNFPNPFNPSTMIVFETATEGIVTIDIFNIRGQRVRLLVNDYFDVGRHNIEWNSASDDGITVANGVYFYRMSTQDFQDIRKMILLK